MISIKRKTLAILILAMLAVLVAQGCKDSSTNAPTDSTDSAVIDTNVSTSVPPGTTDPIPDVDEASGQTDSEPEDNLKLVPDISAVSESAININEEIIGPGAFYSNCSQNCGSVVYFWTPSCEGCIEGLREVQKLYERYFPVQFFGIYSSGSDDNEQDPRQIITGMGITFPNLADHDMTVLDSYLAHGFYETVTEDVATLPALFVINESRTQLVYSIGRPIDSERLDRYLTPTQPGP